MEGRIAALQRRMPEQADALLLLGSVNRYYYTAFSSSAGYLFVAKEKAVLLVDGRYIEAARRSARDCEVERIRIFPRRSMRSVGNAASGRWESIRTAGVWRSFSGCRQRFP